MFARLKSDFQTTESDNLIRMRTVSISVTEASRNFADCVNRVRYQGTTFILHKNGVPVARLVPEPKSKKEETAGDSSVAGDAAAGAGKSRPGAAFPPEIW
jgi:prevent-host-death family protein